MNQGFYLTLMMGGFSANPVPQAVIDALMSAQVTTTVGSQGGFQHVAAFLIGKQNRFAGRALDDDARNRRARVALNVRFNLFVIDLAVGIERRRDGWENSG